MSTFNFSAFTIKFELIVNENSTSVKILDPSGYSVKIHHISDDLSGYISNEQPKNGSWNICTIDENSQFTITKKDILDFTVDYYKDGHYSAVCNYGCIIKLIYTTNKCVSIHTSVAF